MPDLKGIQKVFVTPLTGNDVSAKEPLGTIRREGNKTYKYIQYKVGSGTVAAVAGNVCYYTAEGYQSHQVTSDLSDSIEVGAGVLQAALTADYYGWIQVKGRAVITPALTAGADGDPLTPTGATDGTLDVTADATSPICAYAIDASDKEIALDCIL